MLCLLTTRCGATLSIRRRQRNISSILILALIPYLYLYQAQLTAHANGRGSRHVDPRAGPLPSELLSPQLELLLDPTLELRSIAGSGTEAVRSLWDIADAYAGRAGEPAAQLLILRGTYCGGA